MFHKLTLNSGYPHLQKYKLRKRRDTGKQRTRYREDYADDYSELTNVNQDTHKPAPDEEYQHELEINKRLTSDDSSADKKGDSFNARDITMNKQSGHSWPPANDNDVNNSEMAGKYFDIQPTKVRQDGEQWKPEHVDFQPDFAAYVAPASMSGANENLLHRKKRAGTLPGGTLLDSSSLLSPVSNILSSSDGLSNLLGSRVK